MCVWGGGRKGRLTLEGMVCLYALICVDSLHHDVVTLWMHPQARTIAPLVRQQALTPVCAELL
jgi:hypothetical protein